MAEHAADGASGDSCQFRCPELLRNLLAQLDRSVTQSILVEGSDGVGRKARVPWIRLFSKAHSQSATKGWYVVYLFCGDGSAVYLSLNQGTTDPEAGFRARNADYLGKRVLWAWDELRSVGLRTEDFLETVDLRDGGRLAANYEAGNVFAVQYSHDSLPKGGQLRDDLGRMLRCLTALYSSEGAFTNLPEGYGPGEALDGFSSPVPLTDSTLADLLDDPGVHVFWNRDGQLLYVGETNHLRDRLRQHLSGSRTSSILREKIGRILDQDLGRDATADEITGYLRAGTFAWCSTANASQLKARIMDELRPALNDVRPTMTPTAAKVLAVYVGQRAERNFQVGLETRTWGFSVNRDAYGTVEEGDWILLATGYTGGNVRTSQEEWREQGVQRVILGRITKPPYTDSSPHWPDERLGEATYPYRLQFEIVGNITPLDLSEAAVLSSDVADAIRLSAINRGAGYVAPATGTLFSIGRPTSVEPAILDLLRICSEFASAATEANLQFGPAHLDFIRAFVVSLCTKGFVLLTGLSGSGKTRIAIAFGNWLGRDRYKVVAVRPDWTSPEPLLGYEDALLPLKSGRRAWEAPDVLRFMLRASRDPQFPYLLVLDEMNLAHVERYFADILSGMESGEQVLPNLVEDPDGYWRTLPSGPSKIAVPANLLIIGTVNVDETTYMFSPKVLDRSNTLEFRVAPDDLRVDTLAPVSVTPADDGLVRGFLAFATDRSFQSTNPASSRNMLAVRLRELHSGLYRYGMEFGHRSFAEALRFAALLEAAGDTNQWRALDLQVKQRILPRMHGTARRLTGPLTMLGQFCFDLSIQQSDVLPAATFDLEGEAASGAALPESFDKVRRMMRNLRANQFTSFSE